MKVVLCFFGLNRRLSRTIGSIRKNIFRPLEQAGVSYETHVAFMEIDRPFFNPRSGEKGCMIEKGNEHLLEPRYLTLIDQAAFDREFDMSAGLAAPDPWFDDYKSVRNAYRALKSLDVVTTSWRTHCPEPDDTVFIYLRADQVYHDRLPIKTIRSNFAEAGPNLFLTPFWATYGGLNDRLACLGSRAALAYGSRLHQLDSFLSGRQHGIHGESFVAFIASKIPGALSSPPLLMRASRMRANGSMVTEIFDNTSGKPLPAAWRLRCYLRKKRLLWQANFLRYRRGAERRIDKLQNLRRSVT